MRLTLAGFWLSAQGAMACPVPPEAIMLVSEEADGPAGYVQMETPSLSAPFEIVITFCDLAMPARDIRFDANMPAHQHGMNFTVDVAQSGENRFAVSNVVFHMPGLWELRVQAEIGGQDFAYTAEVMLE